MIVFTYMAKLKDLSMRFFFLKTELFLLPTQWHNDLLINFHLIYPKYTYTHKIQVLNIPIS